LFLEQLQNLFELDAQLPDDLLALGRVLPGAVARQLLASTGNGEALVVKQAADLADDDDVMPLVVTPVATALYRLELGKLLLPVTQNVRLDAAQLGNFPIVKYFLPGMAGNSLLFPASSICFHPRLQL